MQANKTLNENEILRHCFEKLGAPKPEKNLTSEETREINRSLSELLLEESERSQHQTVMARSKDLETEKDFKSIIIKSKDGKRIVTFAIKAAALEMVLPL